MTYLDCSVKGCSFNNQDGCCCKGDIQVEARQQNPAAPVAAASRSVAATEQHVTH